MYEKIRIAIVDNHRVFCEGMQALFEKVKVQIPIQTCIVALNGKELIEQLPTIEVDVILLDIEMPIMNGFETTKYLKIHYPHIKIIILSGFDEQSIITGIIKQGAHGFISKDEQIEEVVNHIYQVLQNNFSFDKFTSSHAINYLIQNDSISPKFNDNIHLSEREIEVLLLIAHEKTNAQIAEIMFISERTVETHRKNLIHKIGVKNTAGLVVYAYRNKYIV